MASALRIGSEAFKFRFGVDPPEAVIVINERRAIAPDGLFVNDVYVSPPTPNKVLRVFEEGGRMLIDEVQETENG